MGIFLPLLGQDSESWQESIAWKEKGVGSAKDLETGIELRSPWVQLWYMSVL